jgi:aminoglycoside 3-N-acetyltransferase
MPQASRQEQRQKLPIITKSRIVTDLRSLGLEAGQTVMMHASVKAIGWIVGGPDVVLDAVLEVLTPTGTLMMYVAWDDGTYELDSWPPEKQQAYLAECPGFDSAASRSYRDWGILTEYIRTRPGAHRSANPEWSMAAIGAKAQWLTEDHALQYGSGPGSPLDKLVQAGGKVLLLGSPLPNVTLLHYAENIAEVANKRVVRYRVPIMRGGRREWVAIEEFDSEDGYFEMIVREFLSAGKGREGKVGAAQSYLFDAGELVAHGVRWMERESTR